MGKLYSYLYLTLDGVHTSPEKWMAEFYSPELGQDLEERLESCYAMALGRKTYTEFANFWPQQGSDVPFADINNRIRKLVVSTSLQKAEWNNSTLINTDKLLESKALGNLHITGSASLVKSLVEQDMLDEIVMIICPIVHGVGTGLYEGWKPVGMELQEVQKFPRGVLSLSYRIAQR